MRRLDCGSPFLVVSYFTKEYQREAERLAVSLADFNLDHYIAPIKSAGSWFANIRLRPEFLLAVFPLAGRPLVWLDADAVVRRKPELFYKLSGKGTEASNGKADVAAHKNSKGRYRVGTMWFPMDDRGREFLLNWKKAVSSRPQSTEQEALNILLASGRFKAFDLPATYCSIFDKPVDKAAGPAVIEHFQASRKYRRIVK